MCLNTKQTKHNNNQVVTETSSKSEVLRFLAQFSMSSEFRMELCNYKEGTFGYIFKLLGSLNTKIAVKMFKRSLDTELHFLGVDFDPHKKTYSVNKTRRDQCQHILSNAGFIPIVLREENCNCKVCLFITKNLFDKKVKSRAEYLLKKQIHFHVYMPFMDGDLKELLKKNTFTLEQRLDIFLKISEIMESLSSQNILNTDLKLSNVLYRIENNTYLFAPCDAGGLYHANHPPIDAMIDPVERYMITHKNNTKEFVDIVPKDQTHIVSVDEVHWACTTHVNIYLRAKGIESNYDLSPPTHLTNQFAILSFFMELVGVQPPTFSMAESHEQLQNTLQLFPNPQSYLEENSGEELIQHKFGKRIREFILKVWNMSSNWSLHGNSKIYVTRMMQDVKHILAPENPTAPRKVLRRPELEERT